MREGIGMATHFGPDHHDGDQSQSESEPNQRDSNQCLRKGTQVATCVGLILTEAIQRGSEHHQSDGDQSWSEGARPTVKR